MEVTEQGSKEEHIEVSYTYKDRIKAKSIADKNDTDQTERKVEKVETEKILRMTKTEILQIEIWQI